jgi:hypothetical protein
MREPAYAAFSALDPFFDIVKRGLAGLVDGDYYFDTIAPDAVFEFRYQFPDWPTKLVGREALMALYAGYGKGMALHGADALVVNISQTAGVVILEGSSGQRSRLRQGLRKPLHFGCYDRSEDCGLARLHGLAGGDVRTNLGSAKRR